MKFQRPGFCISSNIGRYVPSKYMFKLYAILLVKVAWKKSFSAIMPSMMSIFIFMLSWCALICVEILFQLVSSE